MAVSRRGFAATQARERRKRFLYRIRMPLTFAAASWLLAVAVVAIQPQWFAPYLAGAGVTGLLWLVHWALWAGDGAYCQRMGSEAEAWTAAEFKKVRAAGWSVFGPIVLTRDNERFDVDLVAVGPRGVLAVETKYTTDTRLTPDNARDRLGRAIWQATQGAKDIAGLLGEDGGATDVKPVVVLWGPGAPDFAHGWTRFNGVTVVAGRKASLWRPFLERGPVVESERMRIAAKVHALHRRAGPIALARRRRMRSIQGRPRRSSAEPATTRA